MAIYMSDDNILKEENINWIQRISKKILKKKYSGIVVDVKSIDTLLSNLSTSEDLSADEYVDFINTLPSNRLICL